MKALYLSAAMIAAMFASPAWAQTQGVSDTEIKIGGLHDLSGIFAGFSVPAVKAIQQHFEEVNVLVKGGNFGWNFREGMVSLRPRPEPLIGTEVEPIHHYHPPVGPAAVIGGFVYRGQAFRDELEGRYIFGDNGTGQVFALTRAPGAPASVQQLFRLPFRQQGYAGLSSFPRIMQASSIW